MPGAYSTDLRELVLVAVEAGEPVEAVAEEFMVGRAAKPMGRGREPIIRDETEVALCRLLEADHHLTLEECRDRSATETGVRVNPWTVGRALRRLDWT